MPEKVKDILAVIFKKWNWLKIIIVLVIIGIVLSGWAFKFGNLSCEKSPIKIPGLAEKK